MRGVPLTRWYHWALIEAADPAVTEGRRSALAAAATARTPELPSQVLPRRAGSLVVGY